ncbi:MAG: hypothetical protein AMJ91_00450 [candidate division Zixibacteria bacterium SM23_73_3]|nr:MAG: hypothetical protein AMJ91_00450 [candidate division Zixibacteria bacterium SM23_73_3]
MTTKIGEQKLLEIFGKMTLIRSFEQKINWLFSKGMIGGTSHLYIGQEAVAVGVCHVLRDDDYVLSTHRGHGHLLAKGGDPKKLMAELMGKKSGYCGGKGGTQHLCAKDINFLGTNGLTAGAIPIATGVALAIKLSNSNNLVVSFFGDGASNHGNFHESLNMASIWKLPIIFLCENNLYAMSLPVSKSTSIMDIYLRAASYSMKGLPCDGMDVFSVISTVEEAVRWVRAGNGPCLVEAKTYRFCGHSKSDQLKYRTREEENAWKKRDPIKLLKMHMLDSKIEPSVLETIEEEQMNLVEEAVKYAQDDDPPVARVASSGVFLNA